MIVFEHLFFSYPGCPPVLRDISLVIKAGAHVAVMGPNGSGKSTLALLMKGLFLPSEGAVGVDGFTASADERSRFEVMKRVGIVFQNPANTIVATTVERELAFGLENLGIPDDEMRARVNEALDRFGLARHRHISPDHLSGGERQRLALAAVMVMRPSHLILDEPASLLDPAGAHDILQLIKEAVRAGTTVVHITQSAAEALEADRVIVLSEGGVVRDGVPREVLENTSDFGIEGLEDIRAWVSSGECRNGAGDETAAHAVFPVAVEDITHWYDRGSPFERQALDAVTLAFLHGSATALLGTAGAGKTTLLEIAAGITPPTEGRVTLSGNPVRAMAFQFPEDQVFGDTVDAYVAFGPENIGFSREETARAVREALDAVGLEPECYRPRDPLMLSGGEKRRVALAGALSMRPDVLLLDEPTAGLDRRGIERMVVIFREYIRSGGTLLFSTHDLRVARNLAGYAAVLDGGRIETSGSIQEVFARSPWIAGLGRSGENVRGRVNHER